jgi:hypothetical protein
MILKAHLEEFGEFNGGTILILVTTSECEAGTCYA